MRLEKVIWDRLKVNAYILVYEKSCIIIDCNKHVYDYIVLNDLNPIYIFITHGHFDHINGITKLRKTFPELKVAASAYASEMFSDSSLNLSLYFGGDETIEDKADIILNHEDKFNIFDRQLICYLTPGHTMGCTIFHIGNMLFTGDTVLYNMRTPLNLPDSSKERFKKSIDFISSNFHDNTMIYSGHGNCFLKSDWAIEKSLGKRFDI